MVRQVLGILASLVVIAGVIGVLTLQLQRSPTQSGSSGPGATAAREAAAASRDGSVSARFSALQDSLGAAIERYERARQQFDQESAGVDGANGVPVPVDCEDLAVLYQAVDGRFVALAAEYQSSQMLLKTEARTRFQELFDRVSEVNRDFDQSGCPRPR